MLAFEYFVIAWREYSRRFVRVDEFGYPDFTEKLRYATFWESRTEAQEYINKFPSSKLEIAVVNMKVARE